MPPPRRLGRPVTTLSTAGSSDGGKNGRVRPPRSGTIPVSGTSRPTVACVVRPCSPSGPSGTPPAGSFGSTFNRSRSRRSTMPSGVGGIVSTRAAPPGPAVRASMLEPSWSPCARTARLTAGRCMLASRRKAAAVAPVGTLDVPMATRMLMVDAAVGICRGGRQDRRHGLQQPVGRERGDVALHEAPEDGSREPCSRGQVVGVPDPTDLPPRGIDVGLLVAAHHLGTEAGGDAVRHRAVELAEPSRPPPAAGRARRPPTRRTAETAARACRAGPRRPPAESSTAPAAAATAWRPGRSGAALRTS